MFLIGKRTPALAYNIKNLSIVTAVEGISHAPKVKQSMLQKT